MTQTHHMTWQTAAGADPEDSPCQTWLEEAVADINKSHVTNLAPGTNTISSHFQTDWASNLWQLFEGPSQFEKPGNITALRVILTWASCLYKEGHQCIFDTLLHKAINKMSFLRGHTFKAWRMKFNEELCLACGLHNGLDSFKLYPGPLHACI